MGFFGWPLAATFLGYLARFVGRLAELVSLWRKQRSALLSKGLKKRDADIGTDIAPNHHVATRRERAPPTTGVNGDRGRQRPAHLDNLSAPASENLHSFTGGLQTHRMT